jgi:oxygen-independent coproporphyrinogen-3 oxidase
MMDEKTPLVMDLAWPLSPRRDDAMPAEPLHGGAGPADVYATALAREAAAVGPDFADVRLVAVRLVGGTPSMMTGAQLRRVMRAVREGFGVGAPAAAGQDGPKPTFTLGIGVRCATVDLLSRADAAFRLRPEARLVSAVDAELQAIGADWDQDALRLFSELLRCRGVDDWGVQVGVGLPLQTVRSTRYTVDRVLELGATHVELAPFAARAGTAVAARAEAGELALGNAAELAEVAGERLRAAGYEAYGDGCYALPGRRDPWREAVAAGADVVGAGLGAHSRFDGLETWNTTDFAAYVAAPDDPLVTVARCVPAVA